MSRLSTKHTFKRACDGSARGVSIGQPGYVSEAKLRALRPGLREIIDRHTKWYEGSFGHGRKFPFDSILAIANDAYDFGRQEKQ